MVRPSLTKIAYRTLQGGKSLAGIAHKEISSKLMSLVVPEVNNNSENLSIDLIKRIRVAIDNLEKKDWEDAEKGLYPKSQLFEAPWIEWAKRYPKIWLDMPLTWKRRKDRNTRDIPEIIDKNKYPDYYLQNFHHQTDGYLSDHSAGLYDLQVEILFNGTADAMRRRVIAPLKKGLMKFANRDESSLRILDIATGTGRTIKQIRSAFPETELLGLDLSDAYLKQASKTLNLNDQKFSQLIRGNAEELPFLSESLQGITCVFLFHELPPKARQNVINESFRVLEPGGIFVLADSIQIKDSPQFKAVMEDFYNVFHEPYYKDYINDDINQRLINSGFIDLSAESHFMTRVWTAYKPLTGNDWRYSK